MKRILVTGLKDPIGGVEKIVLSYVLRFDVNQIQTDFVIFGDTFSESAKIEQNGGKIYYLHNRIKHPKKYKSELKSIFKNTKYDAVWCNFSGLTNIDFLTYAKKYNVPVRIAHSHVSALAWQGRLMSVLVPLMHGKNKKKVFRYTTDLWACSEKSARFMYGDEKAEKTHIIPNAVATEDFKTDANRKSGNRKKLGISDDTPVFCHVGRMCFAKNQKFLLDIFNEILKTKPTSKLLFVGEGELESEIKEHAKMLGIGKSIIFTGFRDDIPDLLSASDVFLLPSVTEGFAVVLIEAQASGLPCIASADAITVHSDVSGHLVRIPLSDGVKPFAKAAIEALGETGFDGVSSVKENGYDIQKSAEQLQRFFVGGQYL